MPQQPPTDNSSAVFPGWDVDVVAALGKLRDENAGDTQQATMLRILWLRREFPGATIDTESVKIERDLVVIRATAGLPDGASGSGFAAELTDDHASLAIALEFAETRAIGRALDVLGLMLPPGNEPKSKPEPIRSSERSRSKSEPTPDADEATPAVVDALRRAARTQPQPRSIRPVDAGEEPAPAEPAGQSQATDVRFTVPTPFPQRSHSEAGGEAATEEPPLEDYSWTAFWRWAREKGMMRKVDIEHRIGSSIDDMNPAEIRIALREAGVDLA